MHSLTILFVASIWTLVKGYTFVDLKTSYIKYKQWSANRFGTLTFRFKTSSPHGLLLYSDNSKTKLSTSQSFIKLQLSKGDLEFTVQTGSEDYKSKKTVSIGKNLNDLKWHEVNITRNDRETIILLNKSIEKILINDGEHDELDLNSDIYVGGVSDQIATSLVDGAVLAMPRFIGCVEDFKFKGKNSYDVWEEFDDPLLSSVGVKDGCLDACAEFACANNGQCINYFTTAKCNCIGTGYYDSNCSKERESIQFDGQSFIDVDLADPLKSTTDNIVTMRFRTKFADGLLFAAYSRSDHMMIELYCGLVRMSMDLGGGYFILEIADISFNDGKWHLVYVKRNGRQFSLTVDNRYSLQSETPGMFSKFNIQDLYIGGLPMSVVMMNSKSQTNFTGCLQEVLFNELDIVYKSLNTESSRFQMFGNIKSGCDVVKTKVIQTRDSAGPVLSKSGSAVPYQPNVTPIKPFEATEQLTAQYAPKFIHQKTSTKLSKQIITWIIIGIIVGSIALIVAMALIVHSFKKRYSEIILSKHHGNNNLLNNHKSSQETVVIYKANHKQGFIQPRLV